MQPMASVFEDHAYVLNPTLTWWNPNVGNALSQDAIGLVTGQTTVAQVLQEMDAAWKHGPA
jgi:raffinose/stachyose/melibiose transport system substrate-binding protein